MCVRAGLSSQQCISVRLLTITDCWRQRNMCHKIGTGLLYHLLESLSRMSATEFQLDCLILESTRVIQDYDFPAPDIASDIRISLAQDLALIWRQNVTKKIIVRLGSEVVRRRQRVHREYIDLFTKLVRLRHINAHFTELHQACVEKQYSTRYDDFQEFAFKEKKKFNFDSDKYPRQWQWNFFNKNGKDWLDQPDEKSFTHIEVTPVK